MTDKYTQPEWEKKFGFEPAMTPDKVEQIVDFIAESKLSRMETAVKVRTMLTQDLMREAVEAERREWLSGNRCSLCGNSNLDSKGLSDVCGKCFEEQ